MFITTPSSPTLDDMFNDGKEPVDVLVDADVIEAVKENIQPLRKGRRATALSAIFSTPHAQRDTILSRKRARFRMQVTQALEDVGEEEGDADPLDVYSRFVAWTLESYPQGQSTESGLLELLEEATRQLKDQEKYKQDYRYIRLWTLYAGFVEKPAIIYSYLLANEIGTNSAQLYEEYAYVLERDGRCREADDIYNLGIARRVERLEHLKKRYADFQRRMLSAPLPSASSPRRFTGPPTLGRRTILGETGSLPICPSATSAFNVFSAPQPNTRLQIFVDPTGKAAERAEGNEFPEVGTLVSRTKENRPEVRRLGDGPLPRSRGTQPSLSGAVSHIAPYRDPPARATFIPFRDEEDATTMPPLATPIKRVVPTSHPVLPAGGEPPATPGLTATPYKDDEVEGTPNHSKKLPIPMSFAPRDKSGGITSEAEALRRNPFKNYDVRHNAG